MYSVLVVREEKVMLAIRLPADIEKRLDDLAKKTGRTKTFYARQAILEHLEDLEDMYLAQAVIERIDAGQEQVFSLEEVEKELGLAH